MTVLPIEVKSGKDYTTHRALDKFLENKDYNVSNAIVLDNDREVYTDGKITYMPIYYIMCIEQTDISEENCYF